MPSWNWDESASESGVVHQSTADTDHDDATILKQGYDYANFSEITPDPDHAYPLHEDSGSTANDLAGTNDGSNNGASVGQTGLLGTTSYSFGGDDYITLPDLSGASSLTISFWCYQETFNAIEHPLTLRSNNLAFFRTRDTSSAAGSPNDAMEFGVQDGGGNNVYVATPMTNGEWVHYVGVVYSDEVRLYENGAEVDSDGKQSGLNSDTYSDAIGYEPLGNQRYWNGRLADVRFYLDTQLSTSQIQTLYNVVDTTGSWTSTTKSL